MHTSTHKLLLIITLFANIGMSTDVSAESLTKQEYFQSKSVILLEHERAIKACDSSHFNAYEICIAEANGNKRNALAKLFSAYRPGSNATYTELTTHANTAYAVALANCNNQSVHNKSTCCTTAQDTKINKINAASMRWGKSIE